MLCVSLTEGRREGGRGGEEREQHFGKGGGIETGRTAQPPHSFSNTHPHSQSPTLKSELIFLLNFALSLTGRSINVASPALCGLVVSSLPHQNHQNNFGHHHSDRLLRYSHPWPLGYLLPGVSGFLTTCTWSCRWSF